MTADAQDVIIGVVASFCHSVPRLSSTSFNGIIILNLGRAALTFSVKSGACKRQTVAEFLSN